MPHKSIVAVDVIWEFRMSKPIQISTEAVRGNIIPTNVSKKKKQIQSKGRWLLLLKRHLKIYF